MSVPVELGFAKSQFFDKMNGEYLSLTFDDVRLLPALGDVDAEDTDITSWFSRNVPLNTPFSSAAMDTVTTAPMAIAMAQAGGIGVVHAGLDVRQQHDEVRHVKLALNGRIDSPITVMEDQSVQDVLAMCDEERFRFRTFPVEGVNGKFAGLLTKTDIIYCDDLSRPVRDAMTHREDVKVAHAGLTIEEAYDIMRPAKLTKLPLLDEYGHVAGMYVLSDVIRMLRQHSKPYNVDSDGRLRVAAAVPSHPTYAAERVGEMLKYLDVAVIDTASGDKKHTFDTLRELKISFGDQIDIVAGNVSTAASAKALAEAGADGIKVGQGGGSICTTRLVTGTGTPQLSAVFNCARAVSESNYPDVPVISDGGIRYTGDVALALAAGASSVMMGSALAGTDEAPGDVILRGTKRVKLYRGMGSEAALRDSDVARMRYSSDASQMPLPEGVEAEVPYKGSVARVLRDYTRGLRKAMSNLGYQNIAAFQTEAMFTRITAAGMAESRPHDVDVISR